MPYLTITLHKYFSQGEEGMPDAQGQGVFYILIYNQAPPHLKMNPISFFKRRCWKLNSSIKTIGGCNLYFFFPSHIFSYEPPCGLIKNLEHCWALIQKTVRTSVKSHHNVCMYVDGKTKVLYEIIVSEFWWCVNCFPVHLSRKND